MELKPTDYSNPRRRRKNDHSSELEAGKGIYSGSREKIKMV